MKVVKVDLPRELQSVEVHVLADLHIGDANCDMQRVKQLIEDVRSNENALCVVNGDILNNSTRTSIGDVYAETLSPMQQIKQGVELLAPIKEKIIAMVTGNHERRTYRKEGIDLAAIMASELGVADRFAPEGVLAFVRFGRSNKTPSAGAPHRKICYTLYTTHGSGGGRKEGAKVIRLADLANVVDADVYIHSHTHLPVVMKQAFYRVSYSNSAVTKVSKLFVNTAAALDFGGYGQMQGYKPASTDSPIIYLSSVKKSATAKL